MLYYFCYFSEETETERKNNSPEVTQVKVAPK